MQIMQKLSLFLLLCLLSMPATAQNPSLEDLMREMVDTAGAPDISQLPADKYVHDPAGLLPQADRRNLEQDLRRYEADSTVRLWVVLVPKTKGFIFSSYKLVDLAENWALTKDKPKRWAVLFIAAKQPTIRSLFAEDLDAPISPLREVFIEEALGEKNYLKAVKLGLKDMKWAIADGLYATDRIPDLSKPEEVKNIYDFSRLVPDKEEAELEQLINTFEEELQADWTVILVPNLPDTTNLARMKKVIVKRWGFENKSKLWLLFFMHTDRLDIALAGHESFRQAASATTAARLESLFSISFEVRELEEALTRFKEVAVSGSYEKYEADLLGPVPKSGVLLWLPIVFMAINLLIFALYQKYWDSSDRARFLMLIFGPQIIVYVLAHQFPLLFVVGAYLLGFVLAMYQIGRRGQYLSERASLKSREEVSGWGSSTSGNSAKPKDDSGSGWA